MSALEYARVLLRQWRVIVGVLLVFVLLGTASIVLLPRMYSSASTIYVSTQIGNTNTSSAYQGSLLSAQRVKSYVELATSERVLGAVVATDGRGMTSDELRDRLTVSTAPDTVLVTLAVSDQSPVRSAQLTDAVTRTVIDVISEIEQPLDRSQPPAVTVRVVQPATTDPSPVSPRVAVIVLASVLLGLAAGAGIAEIRRRLDDTVKSNDVLVATIEAPSLGSTLEDESISSNTLVTVSAPRGRSAEEFRKIRTNLEYVDVDNPPRVIVLTSALPGEGKTTTVANIAVSVAASGRRVAVLDGDLRKPRVADVFGVEQAVGLTTVLSGRVALGAAVQKTPSGVDVLASGLVPPNPAELLGSGQMRNLLSELRVRYDLVLIDSPPVLLVTDSAALAPQADGVVVVARYGSTGTGKLMEAVESIRKTGGEILGAVLSFVPWKRDVRYGEYGYYGMPQNQRPDFEPSIVPKSVDDDGTAEVALGRGKSGEARGRPSPRARRGTP